MTEGYREQHPLLYEDPSDEELRPQSYTRSQRLRISKGRAKHTVQGAAIIIAHWPGHWSTFLKCWWIVLVMIAITTFVIYNTAIAFALIPTGNTKTVPLSNNIESQKAIKESSMTNVFMHMFVNDYKTIEKLQEQYLPFVNALHDKYEDFNYHLIFVLNDTSKGSLSAEENNDVALNSLWDTEVSTDLHKSYRIGNISIEYLTISELMNASPLKLHWRRISYQLIPFLTRTISIWDKGGITLNPLILTPQSPHKKYIEKVYRIMTKFAKEPHKQCENVKHLSKAVKRQKIKKHKKKVNNIQDIIKVLENEDVTEESSNQNLIEAENIYIPTVENNTNKIDLHNVYNKQENMVRHKRELTTVPSIEESGKEALKKSTEVSNMKLLPKFIEYFFPPHNSTSKIPNSTPNNIQTTSPPNITQNKINRVHSFRDFFKPIEILSVKNIKADELDESLSKSPVENTTECACQLTIDLKGNILATKTACHAFLGTLFSDAIHHTEEVSLTDFIIAELSLFCKGLLSSCNGIDVILI